jgi:Phage integrase, N-terminal SAM-like domain
LEGSEKQLPVTIQQAEVTADLRAVRVLPALRNRFLGWCEDRGLTLAAIRPHDVATYIEELQAAAVQAPSVKQQLAAIRMLLNCLVTTPGRAEQSSGCGPRTEARC